MVPTPDDELTTALRRATRFRQLVHVAACASTQDLAAAAAAETDTVFWADHQTHGRGRQERPWSDAAGRDLLVTFLVHRLQLPLPLGLPAVLPLAVARTVEPLLDRPVTVKWPNDVLVDGRKLAGVLVDARGDRPGRYAIGIGLNVDATGFAGPLQQTATSLRALTGRSHDRGGVLLALAGHLDACLAGLERDEAAPLVAAWRQRLGLDGRTVEVVAGGRTVRGRLTALDFTRLEVDGEAVPLGAVQTLRAAP